MKLIMLFLKGVAMGAANVIPGVSGGTVAFITGIYERLIAALKNIDLEAIRLFFSGNFVAFEQRTDLRFLAVLFLGVFISILSLAKALEVALQSHETLTLSFFFGLILASIVAVTRQMDQIAVSSVLAFVAGTAVAVGIAFLPPAQPNDNFFYLVLCGVAAVSSMILPGLSGAYVLLLMGNYLLVLQAVSGFHFGVLIPIGIGCIVGLAVLARVLSYLFANFKNETIAMLSGFVAGSLLIIWPWKTTILESFDRKEKAVGYIWNLPALSTDFVWSIVLIVVGFSLVMWMESKSKKQ